MPYPARYITPCEKLIVLLFAKAFRCSSQTRSVPRSIAGGALVPLRSGSSANVVQGNKEIDSRHLRQCSSSVFANNENNNFSGV